MSSNRLLVVIGGCLLAAAPAAAYIDPGTAGLVVGGAGGILVWLLGALAFVRFRLLGLLGRLLGFFRRHPGGSGAGLVLAVLAAVVGAQAMGESDEAPVKKAAVLTGQSERVFLLGLDGADPEVLQELMEQGLLPNFKRLSEQGAFKPLAIPNPAESPVVWASLATGKNPGRHGVFDFIGRDQERYLPNLALIARDGDGYRYPLKTKAFWDVASEHGVPATLLRWPMTFPPERLEGKVLPGLGVPDVRGSLGRYTYFTDEAPPEGAEGNDKVVVLEGEEGVYKAELLGPRAKSLMGEKDLAVPLEVRASKDGALIRLGGESYSLREGEWTDFITLTFADGVFDEHKGLVKLHLASARAPFALYATPVQLHPSAPMVQLTHPAEYGHELHEAIGPYYTLGMPEDTKALGEGRLSEEAFLAMCDDVERQRRAMLLHELDRFEKGVLAFVFDTSDRIQHMTPASDDTATSAIGRYLVDFDRFLGKVVQRLPPETPLILFSDHGFSTFERALDLNRWLVQSGYMVIDEEAWAARPPGSHGELYRYVDWSKTRAYAVGFAGIFVNVAGREGQGIVQPEDRAALVEEMRAELQRLRDPKGGEPVLLKSYAREDLYDGTFAEEAPDLVLGLREGYRGSWQSAVGGVSAEVLSDNDKPWQRDHIVDASLVKGTLLTNFPLGTDSPSAYDLAPTVLSLLGVPVPSDMEGAPLQLGTRLARREAPEGEVAQ